jgi:hypothetical protein
MQLSFKEWFEVELQKDILKEDAMGQIDQLGKKFWQGLVNAVTGTVGKLFGKDSSQPPPPPTPPKAPGVTPKTPAEKAADDKNAKMIADKIAATVVPLVSKAATPPNSPQVK